MVARPSARIRADPEPESRCIRHPEMQFVQLAALSRPGTALESGIRLSAAEQHTADSAPDLAPLMAHETHLWPPPAPRPRPARRSGRPNTPPHLPLRLPCASSSPAARHLPPPERARGAPPAAAHSRRRAATTRAPAPSRTPRRPPHSRRHSLAQRRAGPRHTPGGCRQGRARPPARGWVGAPQANFAAGACRRGRKRVATARARGGPREPPPRLASKHAGVARVGALGAGARVERFVCNQMYVSLLLSRTTESLQ